VGTVLVIAPPDSDRTWRVTGADAILEPIDAPPDGKAGPDGWRFRARAAGDGELTFTADAVPACPDPPRCPPAGPQLAIPLVVLVRP
jgi:hypothetical protein